MPAPATVTWLGHSAFRIETGSATVLIDPFLDGNPKSAMPSAMVDKADLVLVTHDHGDHVGQAIDICKRTRAKLLAIVETAVALTGRGLPAELVVNGHGINIGGTVRIKDVEVTMVQAVHSSESGLPVGYVIRLPDGATIYHAGDTGIFSSMALFGELWSIDLALLPIGGTYVMDPRHAALACRLLKCARVVPMHWGSFGVLEQSVDGFAAELARQAPETALAALAPGESLRLVKS